MTLNNMVNLGMGDSLMPNETKIVDELCFVKSMHTEVTNHDPAITFFQTGHSNQGGQVSLGWLRSG